MSIPAREALLEAALKYLEHELMPTLQGEHRFKTRLAINALRIVQREAAQRAAEADTSASRSGEPASALQALDDAELSRRISDGEIATDDPALRAHLRQSLRQALSVNNPKWLTR